MNIIKHEIKSSRKTFLVWTIALSLYNILIMSIYPSMAKEEAAMEELLSLFPESMIKIFHLDKLSMTDPFGFYATEAYSMYILFGSMFAALIASNLLAKEENDRTIEFLLSKPITRNQILTSKLISYLVMVTMFNLIVSLATFTTFEIVVGEYSKKIFLLLMIGPYLAHITFANLGFLLSAFVTRKKSIYSASLGLVIGLYVFGIIAALSDTFLFLEYLSPFRYLEAVDIVINGTFETTNLLILLIVNILAISLTYVVYNRKDISA